MPKIDTKSLVRKTLKADAALDSFTPPIPQRRRVTPENLPFWDYVQYFYALAKNPLELFTDVLFEEPIVETRFLGRKLTHVNAPDGIHHYLVANASRYRFNDLRQAVLAPILRNGLVAAEGQIWKRTRRALAPVFSARHIKSFAPKMLARAQKSVSELQAANTTQISLSDEMVRVTFDVLMDCLFSADVALDRQSFTKAIDRIFSRFGSPHPFDIISAPKWLPRLGHGERDRIMDQVRHQLTDVITARRRQMTKIQERPDDLLSLLMQTQAEDAEKLSDEDIVDNLLTFIVAGHETTARSLTWTLYLLSKAPLTLSHVEKEMDAAPLSSLMPCEWLEALPFTSAVLKETMRLYPAAGVISRVAVEADRINGVEILPGTEIFTSPWVVHRHRKLWHDPESYDPMRFFGEASKQIKRFSYIPFGAGPRVCIGAGFSMQEMIIILVSYLKAFRFHYVGENDPLPVLRLTLRPSIDIRMTLESRHPVLDVGC
jgi:cytochrome P450